MNLDVSSINFTNMKTDYRAFINVPNNCAIYVKDASAKEWMSGYYPELTNVQIKEVSE
jgi:hypothetical protein